MIALFLPLLLGLVVFATFALVGRWFVAADPSKVARRLRVAGGGMMMAVGAFLVARGQIFLGFSLIGAGLSRLGHSPGGFGGFGGGPGGAGAGRGGRRGARGRRKGGQTSTVRTARLEAWLDHDTAEMDAEILAGRFEGKSLSQLDIPDVIQIWQDCSDDEESRSLLEAYLDRRHPDWRDDVDSDTDTGAGGSGRSRGRDAGAMTEEDACEILGIERGASEAEVRAAHRRLMKQVHPDHGGSTYFAAKLNEAKEVLLRRRK